MNFAKGGKVHSDQEIIKEKEEKSLANDYGLSPIEVLQVISKNDRLSREKPYHNYGLSEDQVKQVRDKFYGGLFKEVASKTLLMHGW